MSGSCPGPLGCTVAVPTAVGGALSAGNFPARQDLQNFLKVIRSLGLLLLGVSFAAISSSFGVRDGRPGAPVHLSFAMSGKSAIGAAVLWTCDVLCLPRMLRCTYFLRL
jgi:hypothetical protein